MNKIVSVDFVQLGDFVEVGSNYLKLADNVPSEVIPKIYGQLKALTGSLHWFIGDFFTQVENLRGSDYAQQMMNDWEIAYARASVCKRVALYFEPGLRRPELSFTHHEEALQICESIEEAIDLLEKTSIQGWTVAKMRQAYAKKLRPSAPPKPAVSFQPVYNCLRFCQSTNPQQLDSDTRAQLKAELKPLVEWHAQL